MTHWQIIIATCLVVATLHGGKWRLSAVMFMNFVLTMALASDPLMVGVADLICATTLLTMGARGMVLSALFLIMIPIYVVFWLFGWPISTTYAIVDCIAFLQIAVLANVDKYLRNHHRRVPDSRDRRGVVDTLAVGDSAQDHRVSEADGWR